MTAKPKRKAAAKKKTPRKKTAKKMGAPSKFTQNIADEICKRLAEAQSLVKICKDDHMPSIATVFNWLRDRPDFLDSYTCAREAQADYHVDEMVGIADDAGTSSEAVLKARLRIETRKWVAGKQKAKKYGDKIAQEISAPGGGPIEIRDMTEDAARRAITDLAGKTGEPSE